MRTSSTLVSFRRRVIAAAASAVLLGSSLPALGAAAATPLSVDPVQVSAAVHHDVSPPLSSLAPLSPSARNLTEQPLRLTGRVYPHSIDAAIQGSATTVGAATAGTGFAGVGQGDYGFSDQYAPPDTNGAVGATQYVQWVNTSFAIFDKSTGSRLYGPAAGNTLWSGFGGACQTSNSGDPIVQYDKAAARWVMTQPVFSSPYLQCVAVSTTSDATGTWNRYSFSYGSSDFNDYPKLGVWPDGYYTSYDIFLNGQTYQGPMVCALNRSAMLAGTAATQQCFQISNSYGPVLPADVDGSTAPPTGTPEMFVGYASNSLDLWRFHVDWSNSANSTLSAPTTISVASFNAACGGGTCIPQPGTSEKLDSLADRVMYRLAYRNFGDHEALVLTHSVTAGTSTGIRWYELRNGAGSLANAAPVVYQQGTYAPDGSYRWMSSAAMDHVGDLAVGYSVSNSTNVYPSIAFASRTTGDALGTLSAEAIVKSGSGSQLPNLSRWGDYSAMSVDPVDDCTLWYTTEYLKTSGTFNWSTWITPIKFAGCTATPQTLTSISVSPSSATLATGATQQFTATALDQNGNPMATQPTFSWSATGGAITQGGLYTAGASAGTFGVTATAGGKSGTASVSIYAPVLTTITVSPSSATVPTGGTQQFTATGYDQKGNVMSAAITWTVGGGGTIDSNGLFTAGSTAGGPFTVTASSGSVSGTASVTVTGSPVLTTIAVSPSSAAVLAGASQQFSAIAYDQNLVALSPQPTFVWNATGGAISSSGLFTAGATGGTFGVTAGVSGSTVTGSAAVTVATYTLSLTPNSEIISRGTTGQSGLTISSTANVSGSVKLSATSVPKGVSISSTANPVTWSGTTGTATLTFKVNRSASAGTYAIAIVGTSGSVTVSTTMSLTIQ